MKTKCGRKLLPLFLLMVLSLSIILGGTAYAKTQKKVVYIYKISGNIVTYRNVTHEDSDSVCPLPGGKKKKITLANNAKYYLFKNGNVNKYKKISKSKFKKRIKNGPQCSTIQIKKGKVVKIWGEYTP